MTWRELARAIDALPEEVKDLTAQAWLGYTDAGEFPEVISLEAYDMDEPISIDNPPSMSTWL